MLAVLQLLRGRSWIKNFFLFFPLIFSLELFSPDSVIRSLVAFIGFSLVSSTIYIINDIGDIDADRLHPRKKTRPLPSGKISLKLAYIMAAVLIIAAAAVGWILSLKFMAALAGYFLLNIAYNLVLKHVNLLDVATIAINFVLRILAGCFAIAVTPSQWIIVVTFFISLFLVFIKRKSELKILKENAPEHRPVLKYYTIALLDKYILINAAVTLFAYVMYTLDEHVIALFNTDKLIYSTPFVAIGLFRFMQLSESNKYNDEGDPTHLLLKDRYIQIVFLLWLGYLISILYLL